MSVKCFFPLFCIRYSKKLAGSCECGKCDFLFLHHTEELRSRYKVYVHEIELEFDSLGFCGGGKTEELEIKKNHLGQGTNNKQQQS